MSPSPEVRGRRARIHSAIDPHLRKLDPVARIPTGLKIKPRAWLTNGASVDLESDAQIQRDGKATHLVTSVANTNSKPLRIARIRLFRFPLKERKVRVLDAGFQMPGQPVGFSTLKAGTQPPGSDRPVPDHCTVWDFTCQALLPLSLSRARHRVLGFTTFGDFEGYFTVNLRGRRPVVSAWLWLEGIRLHPGAQMQLEALMVVTGSDLYSCLDTYTTYTAARNRARVPAQTVTGWSDWQYYQRHKTEDDILKNARALQSLKRQGVPLDCVQVDAGWCDHDSEWLKPCDKFPSGMRSLSGKLKRLGFKLGLWFAPYITNIKTEVARRHPDWMVRDTRGREPLFHKRSNVGPSYVLDFTVPAAQAWLRRVVRTMVKNWGVAYIKLDGPALRHYTGGRLHDPDTTTIQMVRRSLEIIREEAGDDVLVEGEGIYGPSLGMVDIQRVTQDMFTFWYKPETGRPALKQNLQNDLMSAFLHGRFWHNHRENIVLRDFPSPIHNRLKINPHARDEILPESELRSQISAAALAGGSLLLTDPITELLRSSRQPELISQLLPNYEGGTCIPVDVHKHDEQPSIFVREVANASASWYILGVFNWEDTFQDFRVPVREFAGAGAWHAFEFWEQAYLGICRDTLHVTNVPAHGCSVIALRKREDHAQLLGTNLHIFQGAAELLQEELAGNTLNLKIRHFFQQDRKLILWHPSRLKLKGVKTNARDHLVDTRQKNLVTVHFNGRSKSTSFSVNWSRA